MTPPTTGEGEGGDHEDGEDGSGDAQGVAQVVGGRPSGTGVRCSGSGVAAELVEADQMQGEVLDPVKQTVEPGVIAD
jgi:hypothetical protein